MHSLSKPHKIPPFFKKIFPLLKNPITPHFCPAGRFWILLDPRGYSLISSLSALGYLACNLHEDDTEMCFRFASWICKLKCSFYLLNCLCRYLPRSSNIPLKENKIPSVSFCQSPIKDFSITVLLGSLVLSWLSCPSSFQTLQILSM